MNERPRPIACKIYGYEDMPREAELRLQWHTRWPTWIVLEVEQQTIMVEAFRLCAALDALTCEDQPAAPPGGEVPHG
jgi:hypothetical protein